MPLVDASKEEHQLLDTTMTYKNPIPVAVGIIQSTTPGNVLLIERADGGLALPGGYVDEHEDAYMAINREVLEEVALQLDTDKWVLFHSAVNSGNRLLLFSYYTEKVAVPLDFIQNNEVLRVLDAPVSTILRFPLHQEALALWVEKHYQ